jgi:hypothetical protein
MIPKAESSCRVSDYSRIGVVEQTQQDVDRLLKAGCLIPPELTHDVRGQASPDGIAVGREFSSNFELQNRATVVEDRNGFAS